MAQSFTWTGISCFPKTFIRLEKRDRSTPLGNKVASANNMEAEMQPRITESTLISCFLSKQRQMNSEKMKTSLNQLCELLRGCTAHTAKAYPRINAYAFCGLIKECHVNIYDQ
jgi:hypothetical protein